MIAGIFHEGSGLGNQLFRYITVRTLAEDKGYEWGMIHSRWSYDEGRYLRGEFKGKFFKDFDLGKEELMIATPHWNEKDIRDAQGNDVRSYDPEINFVEDNTIIDGSFEDPRYWEHRMEDIGKWLMVEPLEVPDDVCIIGFRGGEYALYPDLYLPHEYYLEGIKIMREKGITKFEVHTDDTVEAKKFFAYLGIECIHDIGFNWRSVRYAKHAIIANSSFFVLPRLLQHYENKDAITVAPHAWGRHNLGIWSPQGNYYKQFTYIK